MNILTIWMHCGNIAGKVLIRMQNVLETFLVQSYGNANKGIIYEK